MRVCFVVASEGGEKSPRLHEAEVELSNLRVLLSPIAVGPSNSGFRFGFVQENGALVIWTYRVSQEIGLVRAHVGPLARQKKDLGTVENAWVQCWRVPAKRTPRYKKNYLLVFEGLDTKEHQI